MNLKKHTVVFSHGFGVRKDDRGLFPDIASGFDDINTVMFDYNEINETENTITVSPLTKQAEILSAVLSDIEKENSEGIIDLVCHSQGSIVAALAKPNRIRKTIFLAPPIDLDYEHIIAAFKDRIGTEINMAGISRLSRKDGSITLVPGTYWSERTGIQPINLYNELASKTELIIVRAKQDDILGETDFSQLSKKIQIIEIDGNHSFGGSARIQLRETLRTYLDFKIY